MKEQFYDACTLCVRPVYAVRAFTIKICILFINSAVESCYGIIINVVQRFHPKVQNFAASFTYKMIVGCDCRVKMLGSVAYIKPLDFTCGSHLIKISIDGSKTYIWKNQPHIVVYHFGGGMLPGIPEVFSYAFALS